MESLPSPPLYHTVLLESSFSRKQRFRTVWASNHLHSPSTVILTIIHFSGGIFTLHTLLLFYFYFMCMLLKEPKIVWIGKDHFLKLSYFIVKWALLKEVKSMYFYVRLHTAILQKNDFPFLACLWNSEIYENCAYLSMLKRASVSNGRHQGWSIPQHQENWSS